MDRGRGRGWRRGRRGGGRHRGWANGESSGKNRAWVRHKGGDSEGVDAASISAAAQNISPSAGPILKGPSKPLHTNQRTTGPILRGPSHQQQPGRGGRYAARGRRFPTHSAMGGRGHYNRNRNANTWKRADSEDSTDRVLIPQKASTETSEARAEKGDDDAVNAAMDPPLTKNGDQFDDAPAETDKQESKGNVVQDQFADAPEDSDESAAQSMQDGKQTSGEQGNTSQEEDISEKINTFSAVASNTNSSSTNGQQEQPKQGKMIHKGSNKLILSTKLHAPQQQYYKKPTAARKRPISPRNHGATVKRIKIQALESAESATINKKGDDDGNEDGDANMQNDGDETKGKIVAETLTNFAYRETSSSNRGRGGRSRSSRGRGGHNHMGLVRVNPDQNNIPICPTFLRGVRCENELCRKRHDVPIEAARPVCSFFQRHGQCLKGSHCPFRHVKVNAGAMLCPSFNLLGYCDDKQCVMKHVIANKSIKNVRAKGKGGSAIDNRVDKRR